MRVAIAQLSHETNTFSPVPTDLARFSGRGGEPLHGEAAIRALRGTATVVGGMLAVAEDAGWTVTIPTLGGAAPSGPVAAAAFDWIAERIVAAAGACDALLLDLHGAMVTDRHPDGERELLRRIRAVAPDLPVAVALDMHANLSPAFVADVQVLAGYQTYPHEDMGDTGRRAATVLRRLLAGEVRCCTAFGQAPMLPHVMRQGSDDEPNHGLQARCRELERSGEALLASLFVGFPHADIPNAGLSVAVVTDGDPGRAAALRDELLDAAWQAREQFFYRSAPLEASMAQARALGAQPQPGPVMLLDHCDNTASGGTMDTTEVLAAILAAGLDDVAFFGIFDPAAVAQLHAAGTGAEVTLALGGRTPMPKVPRQSRPLVVTGTVGALFDGRFRATGPMGTGAQLDMGRAAVLRVAGVDIIVVSRHIEPYDPGCFESFGIDPARRRYLGLKSRVHWRAGFRNIAGPIVECAGTGVCTSDYAELEFTQVRRPVWPLDRQMEWRHR